MDLFTQRNIYLALSAFAVILVLAMSMTLWNTASSQAEIDDIINITTNVQTLYAGQNYVYTTVTSAASIGGPLIPKLDPNIVDATGATSGTAGPMTRWGQPLSLAAVGGPPPTFSITLNAVPISACQDIETSAALAAVLSGTTAPGTAATALPVDPGTAATNCTGGGSTTTGAGSSSTVTMTLVAKPRPGA